MFDINRIAYLFMYFITFNYVINMDTSVDIYLYVKNMKNENLFFLRLTNDLPAILVRWTANDLWIFVPKRFVFKSLR